jgi:Fe-S-cluster containining protein
MDMSSNTTFSCTLCGRCCTGLRLPLSVPEAIAWLERGNDMQVFCEAIPWPEEPPVENAAAHYKRRRSFAAMSEQLPLRVIVGLMASFDGPCPNLLPDRRCGIYADRPGACRIYPAEVNPFIALVPADKLCPSDAWQHDEQPNRGDITLTHPTLAEDAYAFRTADARDAAIKARVCAALGIRTASLSNEGLVIHTPPRDALLVSLHDAWRGKDGEDEAPRSHWVLISNRSKTLRMLHSAAASAALSTTSERHDTTYLGFFDADLS